ncbi:hypothetical protein GR198_05870 [Rhizobium leguminosarum]|uniref:hypothetical protein n=1 Tax=Rhizobium leguminosarum TaxID=384 RepID=UPI0013C27438|nr:hypothetical protein [Rhizobium leguminosarum]NEH55273.1 hypothetical protein [Rhizobium leguminosarum]
MSIKRYSKQVTFRHLFKLPSVRREPLPPGTYDITVEERTDFLGGHPVVSTTNHIHFPDGFFKDGQLGGSALLNKGELEKALTGDSVA